MALAGQKFAVANGKLFFKGWEPEDPFAPNQELWVTDGTGEGTLLVKDINPGSKGSSPRDLVTVGDRVFFNAYSPRTHVRELWVTDGTNEGTFAVQTAHSEPLGVFPTAITDVGGNVFFIATDDDYGPELWVLPRHDSPLANQQPREQDIRVSGVDADAGLITLHYENSAGLDGPLEVGVFLSSDRKLDITDTRIYTVQITASTHLLSGEHSFSFSAERLSRAISDAELSDSILVVVDPDNRIPESDGDAFNEDNLAVLSGVLKSADRSLLVLGTDGDETVHVTSTAGVVVVESNGESYTFSAAGVERVVVLPRGGTNVVDARRAMLPVQLRSTNGNDTVVQPLRLDLPDRVHIQTDGPLTISLPTHNIVGDPITYTARLFSDVHIAAEALALDLELGLRFTGDYSENHGGAGEKWLQSDEGWHFILPDGKLYRWTDSYPGEGFVSGSSFVSQLSPRHHADPSLLYDAPVPNVGDRDQRMATEAYRLDQTLQLRIEGDYSENWGGLEEKWIKGAQGWFFITPDGKLYHPSRKTAAQVVLMASTLVSDILDERYYADPSLLHEAQLPEGGEVGPDRSRVEVVDGNLQITPAEWYVGEMQVSVTATDGYEWIEKTFNLHVANSTVLDLSLV